MNAIKSKKVLYADRWYLIEWDDYRMVVNESGASIEDRYYITQEYLSELTYDYRNDDDYLVRRIYTAILMRELIFSPDRQEEFLDNWDGDLDAWISENVPSGGKNNV